MSTRSNICLKRKDGTIESIYCHNDGYLSYNGEMLLENYNSIDKVEELINLNDISSLKETIDSTSTYNRDWGENTKKKISNNLDEYLKELDILWIEYIYIFDEEKDAWYYTNTYNWYEKKKYDKNDIKLLTEEEINKEG